MTWQALFISLLVCGSHAVEPMSPESEAFAMLQKKSKAHGFVAKNSSGTRITVRDHAKDLPGWDQPVPDDRPEDWLSDVPIEQFILHCMASIYALGNSQQAVLTDTFVDWWSDFNDKFVAIEGLVWDPYGGTDQVVLYRRGDECVLAVSGTDDMMDAGQDLNVQLIDACGTQVHKGMYHEAEAVSQALYEQDNEMLNYFTSDKCKKRYATGHSLGGGVIHYMAFCLQPLVDIKLDGLYSQGAPGTCKDPIPVDREPDFPAYRMWTTRTVKPNKKKVDLVPWVMDTVMDMAHPKMTSVRYNEVQDHVFERTERPWTEEGVIDEPTRADLPGFTPSMSQHMIWYYEEAATYTAQNS